MSFAAAIRAFGVALRTEQNRSPETRRAYLSDVRQLAAFVGESVSPDAVTPLRLRAFLASLHRSCDAATVSRKISAIRAFYAHLQREGACAQDPTVALSAPKARRRLPKPLAVDDCEALVEAGEPPEPAGERGRERALRDRALVELLYGAGLRVSEVVSLDVRDVDLRGREVRVWGKGGKERIVPLPSAAREAVLLNAGAALATAAGTADGSTSQEAIQAAIAEGVRTAASTIDSGAAQATLVRWVEATGRVAAP